MSNLARQVEIENKIRPHLKRDYYTLIAPSDPKSFDAFVKLANLRIDGFSIHDVLSNRAEIRKLVETTTDQDDLRVYVVYGSNDSFFMHSTIEEYITDNKLNIEL